MEIPLEILVYVLGAVLVVVLLWLVRIERRLRIFFASKKAQDFETVITSLIERSSSFDEALRDVSSYIEHLNSRLQKSTKRAHMVRYNAFPDAGGNQSFALALLDEGGDGVIISSLYGRDHTTVYAKPVEAFVSNHDLTKEEQSVIDKAKSHNHG